MELYRVVLGRIKELPVVAVAVIVVLGLLDVKVGDPAQLTEHVALEAYFRVLGDASALDIILLVGV